MEPRYRNPIVIDRNTAPIIRASMWLAVASLLALLTFTPAGPDLYRFVLSLIGY